MKWERIPDTDKKTIAKGEQMENLTKAEGYKDIIDYLFNCKTIAESNIMNADTKKMTDLELRTRLMESQIRIKIYNELQIFINSTIEEANKLNILLLDQDNGRK